MKGQHVKSVFHQLVPHGHNARWTKLIIWLKIISTQWKQRCCTQWCLSLKPCCFYCKRHLLNKTIEHARITIKKIISLVCKSFSRPKNSIQDSFVSQLIPQTMLWVTNKTLAKWQCYMVFNRTVFEGAFIRFLLLFCHWGIKEPVNSIVYDAFKNIRILQTCNMLREMFIGL